MSASPLLDMLSRRRFRLLIRSAQIILFAGTCRVLAAEFSSSAQVTPCALAHYSFGTAVHQSGLVLFTEFSHRQIRSWDPTTGSVKVWHDRHTPGMYGLATGSGGDVFVGLDLGDTGNPGKVMRISADGREEFVMENVTRPRQLTCDSAGNLFAVMEGGKVLKWTKSDQVVTEVMRALSPVSGIGVGSDGSVYVSEYGVFDVAPEGHSRPSGAGQIKVKRPNGEISVLARGFWRARGMALHGNSLYLCCESNREDQGNAGQLVRIDTTTSDREILLDRLDYPQFPAASPDGGIYFTLGRDNRLMVFNPAAFFHKIDASPAPIAESHVRSGNIVWAPAAEGATFSIRAQPVQVTGVFRPDEGSTNMDGWIEIPADQFQLNPNDLHPHHDAEHPAPGLFELPQIQSGCDSGKLHVEVFPIRRHQGSRWPMQQVGTAKESPAPGFSEQPAAFLFYFSWSAAPPK